MTHRTFASALRSQGVTGDLRLISCNAGQCDLAQNLANQWGSDARAATDSVFVMAGYSDPAIDGGGIWRTFVPRSTQ